MERVTVTGAPPHAAAGFVRVAVQLLDQAREAKRAERAHRKRARQCWEALRALREGAAGVGIEIRIEGVAEEETHGPDRNP